MTITVWDCDYCQRVNPNDRFGCLGCGSPRMRDQERNISELELEEEVDMELHPYFVDGGVSIRNNEGIFAVWK